MTCDLHRLYGQLSARVPETEETSFTVNRSTFSAPELRIKTDRLIIEKSHHDYDSFFRADFLQFFASKQTYRELALLILNAVFWADATEVELDLIQSKSDIKRLVISPGVSYQPVAGYQVRPHSFEYWPSVVDRYPGRNLKADDSSDCPSFLLSNATQCVGVTDEDWKARDTVLGFGSDRSNVRLAQLLLDMGRGPSTQDEVTLEGSAGLGGVGRHSAEVRFWLPGSLGWNLDPWVEAIAE